MSDEKDEFRETWAIANQKGGVGKTTTTLALGELLATQGQRTLLIDIDPHASLSGYLGYTPERVELSSYNLFLTEEGGRNVDPRAPIVSTAVERLDLIPAATALAALDRQSGRIKGLGVALKKAVGVLSADYTRILIDCPPVLGILLINALAACDRLIIPVQTETLALRGLKHMLRTHEMVSNARTKPLPYVIVPTMYDPRLRVSLDCLTQLRRDHREQVWFGYIPSDPKLREASRAGVPPIRHDPNGRAALAYRALLGVLERNEQMNAADFPLTVAGTER